jgi:hypothetical protein
LVKWCVLPYKECTWESPKALQDDDKINKYKRQMDRILKSPKTCNPPSMDDYTLNSPTTVPTFKNGLQLMNYQLAGLRWVS